MPRRAGWLAPAGLAVMIGACAGPAGPARPSPGPPRPPAQPARLGPPPRSATSDPAPSRSQPEDLLIVSSELGDPIGEGGYLAFDYPDAEFAVVPGDRPDDVTLTVRSGSEGWSIRLAAPLGQGLDVGSFLNAERTPGSLTPGLDVRRNGRGCAQTFGAFTIGAVGFDVDGHLAALDATLTQRCEFPDAPALQGTITYRAAPGT